MQPGFPQTNEPLNAISYALHEIVTHAVTPNWDVFSRLGKYAAEVRHIGREVHSRYDVYIVWWVHNRRTFLH